MGTLAGNRDAFGQIVSRYESLVCSLTYCATGNLGQSEDLAQETFITAWKHLGQLRERDKLRSWLCGIARNRINNFLRREGREPLHKAGLLDEVSESNSPEPLPDEYTISNEEQAILWRSLERIPEIYREPLVLFYREHQSIEAVAQDLELSEDAVKQRLSRGRKMLQEQVLAFVEGALEQTNPGKTFTLGVMATLPLLATTAKAATATAAATKGGAMAKATGLGAFLQAIAALSPILLLGSFFGFKMGGDARQSSQQRESVATFWRIVVGSFAAFIALPFLLLMVLNLLPVDFSGDFRQRVLGGMTIWLGLMYAVLPAALILWAWQRRRKFQSQAIRVAEAVSDTKTKKRVVLWVVIAMVVAACLLVLVLSDTNKQVQNITTAEVQKMVAESKGKDIQFSISQFQSGYSHFFIMLRENGKRVVFSAPVDDATLALLKERGIKCPTYVQGRDFEVFGWPGRLLPVFCIFILAIGGVVLLRRPGKFNPQEMDAQQTVKLQRVERVANKAFGTAVALVLIAISLLLVRFTIHHDAGQTISVTEAWRIIVENKDARVVVIQYNNGSKELNISLPGRGSYYSADITSADESTLALLAENKIPYKTLVQGRDFGYRQPSRWLSLSCSFILAAGAVVLLWRAWKTERKFPASAEANV